MTKTEVLNSIIDITRSTGGIPGKLFRTRGDVSEILDELLEEGLIVSTIQHYNTLPDDEWIIPSNCYNVWLDKEPCALEYVRLYLGIELSNFVDYALKDVKFMSGYANWLTSNANDLLAMTQLKDVFDDVDNITFNDEEIAWINTRGWYIDNKSVKDCLSDSLEHIRENGDDEIIETQHKLIKLYKTDITKYGDRIAAAELDIDNVKKFKKTRVKLNMWLNNQDQTSKIKSLI